MAELTTANPGKPPPSSLTPRPRPAGPGARLPVPPTTLVGRELEVAAVCDLLRPANARLLTLTGPGGVGKTRLALRVARDLEPGYTGGVAFVDLAPVRDPDLVAATIATVLVLRPAGDLAIADLLLRHLRDRRVLLDLDNFEQVLPAAPLVATLLAGCPNLSVLVTSREPLHLSAEQAYPVMPLAVPAAGSSSAATDLASNPAVALFARRARAADPSFVLTERNAAAVAGIVRRLDGLPLAIELAAARIRVLSPESIGARLDASLRLLTGGARDLPDRQRTMRGAIGWSYDALSGDEQTLFQCLSVFVGGFSLVVAESVAAMLSDGGFDVLDGIASLVDKSLVRRDDPADGEPRYTMLETVREFGWERLAASGKEGVARDAHAAYFLAYAEETAPRLRGPGSERWLARHTREYANLRLALDWFAAGRRTQELVRLAAALSIYWMLLGQLREGQFWLEQVLEEQDATSHQVYLDVLFISGWFAHLLGESQRGEARLADGLTISRQLGAPGQIAGALADLGIVAEDRGEYDRAETLLTEAATLAATADQPYIWAAALAHLGVVAYGRGELEVAEARLIHAKNVAREIGDWVPRFVAALYLAHVSCDRGD